MKMMSMGGGGDMPLTAQGVDFSNMTQAMDFLAEILDDTTLKVVGNHYATYFWYGVVVFVGLVSLVSLVNRALLRKRLRDASVHSSGTLCFSTLTAISREATYPQITPLLLSRLVRIPPFGSIAVILLYFAFIIALEFANNNLAGAQHYQALGIRAGWLAVSQVPLLILLAGKANIVGWFIGVSYERLNVYHRWVARGLLMLSSMHFGFQSTGWREFGLMKLEWATDTCPPTGIAAYALVLWMNLSTLAPFRHFSYKFFVIQHFITFVGFIVAIMYHLPSTALYSRVYIWVAIGLYLLEKFLIRPIWFAWNNLQLSEARFEAMNGFAVKITISNSRVKSWQPGAHVRLRFPALDPWHAHPATMISRPDSHGGDLVFLLRRKGWLTRKLISRSESNSRCSNNVLISGPYLASQNDFAAYDSAMLISGGTGVTFNLGILLDLAGRLSQGIPVRSVTFVWVVSQSIWVSWVLNELQTASEKLQEAGVDVSVQIFVTRDAEHNKAARLGKLEKISSDSSSDRAELGPVPTSYWYGRPEIRSILTKVLETAQGETAVSVCGPLSLVKSVRNEAARLSDERAVHKGTGAQGLYLHVANTDYSF